MRKASATVTAALVIALGAQAHAAAKCPVDSVRAGTSCMDKYEASVWFVRNAATTNKSLVKKIQQGKATLADLAKGGASQVGAAGDDYGLCSDTGALCADFFAVSVAGATPSAYVTWFQAVEACGNSQKRLPTNVEWQKAVTNTPDNGDNGTTSCNTASTSAVVSTGSRSACVSSAGAFDMVGNLSEWVADWVGATGACPGWGGLSDDAMCLDGGIVVAAGPGVLTRGGGFLDGAFAGPLAVEVLPPTGAFNNSYGGFRCVR